MQKNSQPPEVVFVSDFFSSDINGGAELTTQALIDSCPLRISHIRSNEINDQHVSDWKNCHWIFGNFANINLDILNIFSNNMKYSVIEYDYKFCRFRSTEKHKIETGQDCDCHLQDHGKLINHFYSNADSVWYMSEEQMYFHLDRLPDLKIEKCSVLSSVFDDSFFANIESFNNDSIGVEKRGWIVLGSDSWIKGKNNAIKYCEDNNLDFQVVWGLKYENLLKKLSTSKGLVYLPNGKDTCPRLVIEAKLLGCELVINDFVQHKNEEWFNFESHDDIKSYLYAARESFWDSIKKIISWKPSISSYTTTRNCIEQNYPWVQCIESMIGFSDQVVVLDGGSTDGTWEKLKSWAIEEPKLTISQIKRDWQDSRHAVFDGQQKAEARKLCTGDFLWQQDADEVVHENDYQKIIDLCKNFPRLCTLIALPVIEYWGCESKVRCDINPWKWRLSRKSDNVTHGIPGTHRKFDEDGKLYAMTGTDGCDYIYSDSLDCVPFASFYTQEASRVKNAAMLGDKNALYAYQAWFNNVIDQLPSVHHYSWFNMGRKIRTYRDFWQTFWESLYDIKHEDTAENNKFFNKPWKDVTENEIDQMSEKLTTEMGGWIFHNKVDFNKKTPHIKIKISQPNSMKSYPNK